MSTATAVPVWSAQQTAIFDWFATGSNHLIVRARAGTGKTTTIIEGINYAPEDKILLCAFNKRIADELTTRLMNPRAESKTLHAIGFSIVRRFVPGVRVIDDRADKLTQSICPKAPRDIQKVVTKLHTLGREIAPHARILGELTDIAVNFECEPDESWKGDGFDLAFVEKAALDCMELASNDFKNGIDFSDMIFLPVRNRWINKQYDLVVVDEAQDMTVAQLEIAQGVCRGRICVVGDDRQAIYGFRGADSQSLDRLKTELHADELGLTTTYRCGKAIVAMAAEIVPDFVAGEMNGEGSIDYLDDSKLTEAAQLGDFILSRVNAPLVSTAMQLLRSGKRTRIAGRDIGAGLLALIRRLAKGRAAGNLQVFIERVSEWESAEVAKMEAANKPAQVEVIHDKAEMLISLTEGVDSVRDVEARIDALFTDNGLGQSGVITCSSVHKAKGLEARRVFVLAKTIRDNNQEERNIKYVAITRAKDVLVWVTSKQGA